MRKSTLFISTDLEMPAQLLDAQLRREEASSSNPFLPAQIIVPNGSVKAWLHLYLARSQGIAINLRVSYLEKALWEILQVLAGDKGSAPPRELEHERYRLLILSVLLDEKAGGGELKPIRDYLQTPDLNARQYCRRVWDVADNMARLIRDYEYHRQDEFIRNWLRDEPAFFKGEADADVMAMERCERAMFRLVARPGGLRDVLSAAEKTAYKTLPQFANEVIESGKLSARESWPEALQRRPIHLFGISQISTYHVRVLRWLGQHLDLRLYHINPLAAYVDAELQESGGSFAALQRVASRIQKKSAGATSSASEDLLQAWAPAAAATLWRMSDLLKPNREIPPFTLQCVKCEEAGAELFDTEAPVAAKTVLQRVQWDLLGAETTKSSMPQDRSLQIVACPGVLREVETIQQSIIHNLHSDSTLRPTDIAIVVTEMAAYRAAIQNVFDRRVLDVTTGETAPPPVAYSLGDYCAGSVSVFGQALLGMIDMGLHAFTRTRVMDVLLNPCFLAKFEVDREKAVVWLGWAERLCVYHGWDRADKKEAGYGDSRYYTWKLALQRLRLGRIMESPDGNPEHRAPNFKDVIPYADMDTGDAQSLNAFCTAVEQLMPRLIEIRSTPASGFTWRQRLQNLIDDFLEIPSDLPDEASVRASIVAALPELQTLDSLAQKGQARELTLPLIREFVQALLDGMETRASAYSSGGVSICAMQPARPIPFRIIYVLGLGEGKFPAPDVASPLDLRDVSRLNTDIRTPEAQRLQFLETVLSAREKLYLLYNCRELQKDQELHPCSLLVKLRKYIETDVLCKPIANIRVPLNPHDTRYLDGNEKEEKSFSDVFMNYSHTDRLLALQERTARTADAKQIVKKGEAIRARLLKDSAADAAELPPTVRVGLFELSRFLNDPADAALKRHLRLRDEDEQNVRDDEPFYTDRSQSRHIVQDTLTRAVAQAARAPGQPSADWSVEFENVYRDRMQKGEAPDAEFASADRGRFQRLLKERIEGGLTKFADDMKGTFFGAVQIGHSSTPSGAALLFPPLRIPLAPAGTNLAREALLSGKCDLVWRGTDAVHLALIFHNCRKKDVPKDELTRYLFEPVLFYLALLAGTDALAGGVSSSQWVGGRALELTIAHEDGFSNYAYRIEAAEAIAYLKKLTNEFVDPRCFEKIPFYTIAKSADLSAAFELADGAAELGELAENFGALLQDALLDEEENDYLQDTTLRVRDLAETTIPADAFQKVRARFRLLDQGPARNRNEATSGAGTDGVAERAHV